MVTRDSLADLTVISMSDLLHWLPRSGAPATCGELAWYRVIAGQMARKRGRDQVPVPRCTATRPEISWKHTLTVVSR